MDRFYFSFCEEKTATPQFRPYVGQLEQRRIIEVHRLTSPARNGGNGDLYHVEMRKYDDKGLYDWLWEDSILYYK